MPAHVIFKRPTPQRPLRMPISSSPPPPARPPCPSPPPTPERTRRMGTQNLALPLEGPTQTNNRAELTACIAALKAVPLAQPLWVVTDSKYVYEGATRYLNRWFLLGQHVTNRDLWEALRDSLSARSAPTRFKRVYSHVGILGNERADRLANQGRLQHPSGLQFLRERCERHGLALVMPSQAV